MEDERRINWLSLFIKIIIIFIFALIIIWLISKINNRNKLSETFTNNINNMQEVSVEYFKTIDLPLVKGQSKKITLKEMIDKDLIVSVNKDSDNVCDTKRSYSKITREKSNYKLETTLKCGKEQDTITKKFSLKDCRNCTKSQSTEKTNESKANKNTSSENKSSNSNTNSSALETNKTTYYEYVKETTTYSKWLRGTATGNNIENKEEYYATASDTYYTLGYIKANENSTTYTIKLNNVPNDKYYFSNINEVSYLDVNDETKYLNEDKVSFTKNNIDTNIKTISKYSLGESNFTYKLSPYYRKGNFYVDITVNVNNKNNVNSYKDNKLNANIYYIPLKLNIKFASDEITSEKPSGEYEIVSYYRYVTVDKETKWSTESSLEGYTKTGNTKVE